MAKACRSKPFCKYIPQPPAPESSPVNIIWFKHTKTITCTNTENQLSLPHIKHVTTDDAAPTTHVTSLNGSCDIEMLPDSDADIWIAGREFLTYLDEHVDNLPSSGIMSQAVNGATMMPLLANCQWSSVWVTSKSRKDEVQIYPEVSGVLMCWTASKGLGRASCTCHGCFITFHQCYQNESAVKEFPTVFDDVLLKMDGAYHCLNMPSPFVSTCQDPFHLHSTISLKLSWTSRRSPHNGSDRVVCTYCGHP